VAELHEAYVRLARAVRSANSREDFVAVLAGVDKVLLNPEEMSTKELRRALVEDWEHAADDELLTLFVDFSELLPVDAARDELLRDVNDASPAMLRSYLEPLVETCRRDSLEKLVDSIIPTLDLASVVVQPPSTETHFAKFTETKKESRSPKQHSARKGARIESSGRTPHGEL